MTMIQREDLKRSLYGAFVASGSITATSVFLDHVSAERSAKTSWYVWQLEFLHPEPSKTDHLHARGSIRVTCRTRTEMLATTGSFSTLDALVDNVVDALDRQQIKVYNYVAAQAGGGDPVMVAIADFGQVQHDDLGEPFNNISTAICTVEFLLSGSE